MRGWGVLLCLCLWVVAGYSQTENVFQYPNQDWMQDYIKKSDVVALDEMVPYVIDIRKLDLPVIKQSLSALFPEARFSVGEKTRQLLVRCPPKMFKEIYAVVKKMDVETPQLMVEVKIMEVNTISYEEYKNVFSSLLDGFYVNVDLSSGKIKPSDSLEGSLTSMEMDGRVRVLAKPTLVMLDNHPATIKVGDRIPYVTGQFENNARIYQVHFLDTGIDLELLPRMLNKETVRINVKSEVSAVKMWKSFMNSEYPVLSSREAETEVDIPLGETLVLAGLFDEQEKNASSAVPILSWIPVIGELFKGRVAENAYSDILFFVTPKEQKKALE